MMLQVRNLSKSYGQNKVLDAINLSFESGKVYGIVGQNGAGKTTFFKCIAGLEAYEGDISSDYTTLKDHVSYLETNPHLMSYITGWEYLKLVCSAKRIPTENFNEQNVFDLPLDQYAETYSTGMKKKLALMGVLLSQREIVILDEPFNGVDIQSNMMIFEIIKELKQCNKIVLISSHIFSTLSETCDQIILLSQGKILKMSNAEGYNDLDLLMRESIRNDYAKKIMIE